MDENRLKLAKELGATHTINPASGDVSKQVAAIVGEDGVDCAIEAVGIPATWNMCQGYRETWRPYRCGRCAWSIR